MPLSLTHKEVSKLAAEQTSNAIAYAIDYVKFGEVLNKMTGITPEEKGREVIFSMYPNPAGNELSFDFIKELRGEVTIEVLDQIASKVRTYSSALRSFILKDVNLAPGFYYIVASGNSKPRSKN